MQLAFEHLKRIADLKYDSGYLLLCDLLQSKVDDLTDELADPNKAGVDLLDKIRYWQALRKIVAELRTQPEEFTGLAQNESTDDSTPSFTGPELWAHPNSVKY